MNRKQQKETNELPKELKNLKPLLGFLSQSTIQKQFTKVWKKKTKCLDSPEKNTKKIKKLQTQQAYKLFYKEITVYTWLGKIIAGEQSKEINDFIKWYKTEYYKISLKDLGIFK